MNTKPITFTLGGTACITMLAIWQHYCTSGGDPPEPTVKMQLRAIKTAIELYAVDHRDFPKGVEHFDAAGWYQTLSNYLDYNPSSERTKKLVDPWDNDFRFSVSITTNGSSEDVTEIRIWSCGRNQRDEHGQGDDIAVTFHVRD